MVSEVSARIRIGASAGLNLRSPGLYGRFDGSCERAALIAACTSRAAPLISRLRSELQHDPVWPSDELDVIWLTPAMRLNCRSSGVATAEAIVSGSAPGSDAPPR